MMAQPHQPDTGAESLITIPSPPSSPPLSVSKPVSTPKPTPANHSTRSIRAHFDTETITLYQAYNTEIANAAVSAQNLSASPLFSRTRTTWLKPSWAWMLYRSGYSYKDANQSNILALKIRHADFAELLSHARIAGEARREGAVVVQWDPERTVRIGKVDGGRVRSIQIGVPASLCARLVDEWVVGIEDVTGRARELKSVLDIEGGEKGRKVEVEELVERGLVPVERVYDPLLPRDVRVKLGMDEVQEEGLSV